MRQHSACGLSQMLFSLLRITRPLPKVNAFDLYIFIYSTVLTMLFTNQPLYPSFLSVFAVSTFRPSIHILSQVYYILYDLAYTPLLVSYTRKAATLSNESDTESTCYQWKFYPTVSAPKVSQYWCAHDIIPQVLRKLKVFQNLTIYLTQAFNQFVNPWALEAMGWKYVSLGSIFNIVHLLIYNCSTLSTAAGYCWSFSS